jgi:methionyl-tRNA formyltransferase
MDAAFLFTGNRFYVLDEMINRKLNIVEILAQRGSYLEKAVKSRGIRHKTFSSKAQLLNQIKESNFDFLISNGCPFILPEEILTLPGRRFINVHPSYLPDLRGADPQPAALLFARDSGATCHVMDMGIDTGEIISRIKIPYSSAFDAALLYQLTFMAEKKAFIQALQYKFRAQSEQTPSGREVYYSFKAQDRELRLSDGPDGIYRKIKAFSNYSKGALIESEIGCYHVFDCELLQNHFLTEEFQYHDDGLVLLNYEKKILTRIGKTFIKFKDFDRSIAELNRGVRLFNWGGLKNGRKVD